MHDLLMLIDLQEDLSFFGVPEGLGEGGLDPNRSSVSRRPFSLCLCPSHILDVGSLQVHRVTQQGVENPGQKNLICIQEVTFT